MLPNAVQTKILADIASARRCVRLARRNGRTPEVGHRRMIDAMARAMRAIDEAHGSCSEIDLHEIGFTWPEIETYGLPAVARVVCIDTDKVLEAA